MLAPRCCEHGANKGFKAKRFKYHANCIFNSKTCTYCTNKRCELQIKLKDSRPNRFKCHANCMFKFQNPVIYIVQIRDFSYTKCSKYRFLSFFSSVYPLQTTQTPSFAPRWWTVMMWWRHGCLMIFNLSHLRFPSGCEAFCFAADSWSQGAANGGGKPPNNSMLSICRDEQKNLTRYITVRKLWCLSIPVSSIGFRAIYAAERISWRKSRSRRARLDES